MWQLCTACCINLEALITVLAGMGDEVECNSTWQLCTACCIDSEGKITVLAGLGDEVERNS
eukprot:1143895-Rhodomonas_salina.1